MNQRGCCTNQLFAERRIRTAALCVGLRKKQDTLFRLGGKKMEKCENTVLCGANSYVEKYYLNQDFAGLPEAVKAELQIMCVMFTEDIGGILLLEFTPERKHQ